MRKPLSPDAVLRLRAETNVGAAVRRILVTFDQATPAMVAAGSVWYPDALVVCQTIATSTGYALDTVVSVLAQMSPRTPWARNVAGATYFFANGSGSQMSGILTANYLRAVEAFKSPYPLSTLNGPKVSSFAANILGDSEEVTIDVWAARIALGETTVGHDLILDRSGVYGALSHAYRLAAARRGVSPAVMQAVTWVCGPQRSCGMTIVPAWHACHAHGRTDCPLCETCQGCRVLPPMPAVVLVECPECGNDFEPEDPTADLACPPCTAADRWDNS